MHNIMGYEELLSLLEERSVKREQDGYCFIVKQIPDSDQPGELDPRVLSVLQQQAKKQASAEECKPEPQQYEKLALKMRADMMNWSNEDITGTEIATTQATITGTNGAIPVRIYKPRTDKTLKAIVYFHGGAFFGGTLDGVENVCKALSEKAEAVVISVDYRLAPEYPYPMGFVDCFDAVMWTWRHAEEYGINRDYIGVAGDSAGANLAAACALKDKEWGTSVITFQTLIYPVVNNAEAVTDDFRWNLGEYAIHKHEEFIMPGIWGIKHNLEIIRKLYVTEKVDAANPYISPLLAESLKDMPETLIITAEFDYLRLECEAFARKLARFGVRTKLIQYNGTNHGFLDKIGLYPQVEDCIHEIAIAFTKSISR